MTLPLADRLRRLPPRERRALYERLGAKAGVVADVRYEWERFFARPDQIVPPEELEQNGLIVFTGNRGSGKTRGAVQLFNREIFAGRAKRPRIFAANEGDVDKAVIHGESGIMACLPPHLRPEWIKSEGPAGVLRYPNKVEVVCFSAKAPEGAVSHQGDLDLYDDVAKWGVNAETAWAHARMSCRIGYGCGIVATTRRGTHLLRKLIKGNMSGVLIRRPPDLWANKYNLTAKLKRQLEVEFEDSDLLRQELYDEDIVAGPFSETDFPALRVGVLPHSICAVAIWIDPSTSTTTHSCEVGIVVVALDARGVLYAVEDLSDKLTAVQWPAVAWSAYDRWCTRVPTHFGVEVNKGGNMGPGLLQQEEKIRRLRAGLPGVSLAEIRIAKATEGKGTRATPLARLIPAGQLKILSGLAALEKQLREITDESVKGTDRADAFVHGGLDLTSSPYPIGGQAWETGDVPKPQGALTVGAMTQGSISAWEARVTTAPGLQSWSGVERMR